MIRTTIMTKIAFLRSSISQKYSVDNFVMRNTIKCIVLSLHVLFNGYPYVSIIESTNQEPHLWWSVSNDGCRHQESTLYYNSLNLNAMFSHRVKSTERLSDIINIFFYYKPLLHYISLFKIFQIIYIIVLS